MDLEQFEKKLDELIKIQNTSGNWNYNPYMRGMANGLIVARSISQPAGDEPKFLKKPTEYLVNKPGDKKSPVVIESAQSSS